MAVKVTMITGAASGIGKALVHAFAQPEHTLILLDINTGALATVDQEATLKGAKVFSYTIDLSDTNKLAELIDSIREQFPKIDVLINNAGVAHAFKPIEELTLREYEETFAVNVKAPFLLVSGLLMLLKRSEQGFLINIASMANIWGYKHHSLYAASKAALTSLTESVGKEVPEGINLKAITILPSRTDTDMNASLRGDNSGTQPPEYVAEVIYQITAGKIKTHNGDDVKVSDSKFEVEENVLDLAS